MTLEERIMTSLKEATINRDKIKQNALKAIKSELLLLKTKSADYIITEKDEISVLQKLVKQRNESALIYKENNRLDLYNEEIEQLEIIKSFLPKQLSEEEIEDKIKNIINELNATSLKDMGKIMKKSQEVFKGSADNKTISTIVKKLLS